MQLKDLRYTAPNIIEGRHGNKIVSIEPGSQLWDLVKNDAQPYTPPPPPSFEEQLEEWRGEAQTSLLQLQDHIIQMGDFPEAEKIAATQSPQWFIRWRSGASVLVTPRHEMLCEFCKKLWGKGWQDKLEGLPIWSIERPKK